MAYDEGLATRIRDLLAGQPGLVEKQMFGGLAFLRGHAEDEDLRRWVDQGLAYAGSLPPK